MSAPFARAHAMMSLIAAALGAHPVPGVAQQAALGAIGPYASRGKGKGLSNQTAAGAHKAFQRAAMKKRRVKAHRKHARG